MTARQRNGCAHRWSVRYDALGSLVRVCARCGARQLAYLEPEPDPVEPWGET